VKEVQRGERFGQGTLQFADPDGMALELVGSISGPTGGDGVTGPVPAESAIRRLHGMSVRLRSTEATEALVQEVFGFVAGGEDQGAKRFQPAAGVDGGVLDLIADAKASPGQMGAGSVHHIAWRAQDDAHQLKLRGEVLDRVRGVTPVIDRQYFHSIYFREPGGVLFEIATDGPGFMTDEPVESLGESLRLPPEYEPQRSAIAAHLAPLRIPEDAKGWKG
jgi:glyoxalase family protein